MNDQAELKQLRRIAKAARRLLATPVQRGHYIISNQYDKAQDALDAALKAWEPEAEQTGALDHFNQS